MSSQSTAAWQIARPRHSHSASRTPHSRSGTVSPSQQGPSNPATPSARPQQQHSGNVWGRPNSSAAGASNGQAKADAGEDSYQPVNNFNTTAVKSFLARESGSLSAYKPESSTGPGRGGSGGGAWASRPNHMATNQPFLAHLAKQISTLEGGG